MVACVDTAYGIIDLSAIQVHSLYIYRYTVLGKPNGTMRRTARYAPQ